MPIQPRWPECGNPQKQEEDVGIDDNERSREMALFRYSAISQALHLEEDTALKQTLMDLAERFWTMPDGSVR